MIRVGKTSEEGIEMKRVWAALAFAEGGKKLEVRGYVGMPMLGRTQTWVRASKGCRVG